MKATVILSAVFLLASACTGATASPADVAAEYWDSYLAGDYEAEAQLLDPDGTFFLDGRPVQGFWDELSGPGTEFGFWDVEDFDGDGTTTFADVLEAQTAFYSTMVGDLEYECSPIPEDESTVECTGQEVPIYEGVGLPIDHRITVEDGKITAIDQLTLSHPDFLTAVADSDRFVDAYHEWVSAEHEEELDALFGGRWPIMARDGIERHQELISEYLSTVDG